jgi:hypothetical protein
MADDGPILDNNLGISKGVPNRVAAFPWRSATDHQSFHGWYAEQLSILLVSPKGAAGVIDQQYAAIDSSEDRLELGQFLKL